MGNMASYGIVQAESSAAKHLLVRNYLLQASLCGQNFPPEPGKVRVLNAYGHIPVLLSLHP